MRTKTIEEIYEELARIREERARMEEQTRIIKIIQGSNLSQTQKYELQLSIYNS